jgi:hypothetical protein
MGWQTGTAPCQPNPAPKPGAIPETCPSGEEPPEATPVESQTLSNEKPPNTSGEELPEANPLESQTLSNEKPPNTSNEEPPEANPRRERLDFAAPLPSPVGSGPHRSMR